MRNKDTNNNPFLVFMIGILFAGIGGVVIWLNIAKKMMIPVLLIGGLMAFCGTVFIIFAIKRSFEIGAYKRVLKDVHAHVTEAKFLSAKTTGATSTRVGGNMARHTVSKSVFKTVYYSYFDENGHFHEVKSALSYVPKQVNYLQQKGTFKIKCRGKVSVIIEELPKTNEKFNLDDEQDYSLEN